MKKIAFILALAALLCLVSCSGKKESTGTAASAPATTTAAAPAEKITLTVWGSQEDQALLKTMCNAYAAANPDKTYKFLYGVQSESDAADKVLNDPSYKAHASEISDSFRACGGAAEARAFLEEVARA